MAKSIHEMSSWNASVQTSRPPDDEWQSTRAVGAATQIMGDQEAYLGNAPRDIGRHLGNGQWELFVVCDANEALQQQFEHLAPEFIAIHDVGAASSRRLLGGVASALGANVQRLTIRRQGHGVALATLEFVELQVGAGKPAVRLYTTETDADTQVREALARVLLAHSRLGVVMVGDLPPHAMSSALAPLREMLNRPGWHNRQLLMLPLSTSGTLAGLATQLGAGTGITVRTTPHVARPADAWTFISGAWNRLGESAASTIAALPEFKPRPRPAPTTGAPTVAAAPNVVPLPMQPMPEVPKAGPRLANTAETPVAHFVRQCGEIKGMVSCCVFEASTQKTIAHAGARPGPAALASQGASLFAAMLDAAKALGLGHAPPDAALTLAAHHIVLRALPHRPGLVLHAVLDRNVANVTLVQRQLQRLEELLEPPIA